MSETDVLAFLGENPDSLHLFLEGTEQAWADVPVSPLVPKEIRDRIEVAKDLYRFSHFRFDFRDAAQLYLLATLEDSLRLVVPEGKMDLMLRRARERGLLREGHHPFWLSSMVKIRNGLAHGRARAPAYSSQRSLLLIIDVINCLHDESARTSLPPLLEWEQAQRERNRNWFRVLREHSNAQPREGDVLYVAPTSDGTGPGSYECLHCGNTVNLTIAGQRLEVCNKCKHFGFGRRADGPAKE